MVVTPRGLTANIVIVEVNVVVEKPDAVDFSATRIVVEVVVTQIPDKVEAGL